MRLLRTTAYAKEHPEQHTYDTYLRSRYGISGVDYAAMLEKQRGVCAVCGQAEVAVFRGRLKRLAVDHDHKTGKIRGLLCLQCNSALGIVRDDAELLHKLAAYLEHEWRKEAQ